MNVVRILLVGMMLTLVSCAQLGIKSGSEKECCAKKSEMSCCEKSGVECKDGSCKLDKSNCKSEECKKKCELKKSECKSCKSGKACTSCEGKKNCLLKKKCKTCKDGKKCTKCELKKKTKH